MHEETRSAIEKAIDDIMQQELLQYVEWVQNEIPFSSLSDTMLGYIIGTLEAISEAVVFLTERREPTEEDDKAIRTIIKGRLPEIVEKINRELPK